jgi:CBS domain-containing protein
VEAKAATAPAPETLKNKASQKPERDAMKIGEFLRSACQSLVTCLPDDTLDAAAKAMHARGIGAMPVCEIGIRMVGIVSERDLVRALATTDWNELRNLRVRNIMTTRVKTCSPDDDMHDAEQLMRRNHFRHVPVVEAGRVVGMLSIRDTQAMRLRESEEEINILRDVVVAVRHR